MIALAVGDDLTAKERLALERHLASCPDCQQYRAELERGMAVIRACELPPADDESLWPAISDRLDWVRQPRQFQLSDWTPLAAIVAACLLVAFVSLRYSGPRYEQPRPPEGLSVTPAVNQTGVRVPREQEVVGGPVCEEEAVRPAEVEADQSEVKPREQRPIFRWPRPDKLDASHPDVPIVPVNEWSMPGN